VSKIASNSQPITQIGRVAMNAVAPSIPEGFDLFGLAGDVVGLAVLHIAAGGGPLKVAVEFDPVWRVKVDALNLAAQTLALSKARHHLQESPRIMRLVQF
jgi:hypothetical protein